MENYLKNVFIELKNKVPRQSLGNLMFKKIGLKLCKFGIHFSELKEFHPADKKYYSEFYKVCRCCSRKVFVRGQVNNPIKKKRKKKK